jgi:hypothetical protein
MGITQKEDRAPSMKSMLAVTCGALCQSIVRVIVRPKPELNGLRKTEKMTKQPKMTLDEARAILHRWDKRKPRRTRAGSRGRQTFG